MMPGSPEAPGDREDLPEEAEIWEETHPLLGPRGLPFRNHLSRPDTVLDNIDAIFFISPLQKPGVSSKPILQAEKLRYRCHTLGSS